MQIKNKEGNWQWIQDSHFFWKQSFVNTRGEL